MLDSLVHRVLLQHKIVLGIVSNISNTRKSVSSDFKTPRSG